MKTFKEYLSKAAGKIMGVAPETPQYKVGQHVNYEMSPPQKGGSGSGKIDSYSNGHYMINGKPINHFEIKSVKESIDEAYGDKKEQFVPKVGANVRIPTENLGQTIGGKVQRQGRSGLWHVKAADGEVYALPEKHVFHPDLSCKNYHEYSWGGNANEAKPVREATEEKPKLETYRVNNDHHNLAINVKAYSAKEAREHATKLNPKFGHKATTSSKSWTRE